jgi:pimeloyl-ACP methyl ester carboxylesterase
MLRHVEAGVLRVAYEEHGPQDVTPVVLLHGFPYDVRVYKDAISGKARFTAQAGRDR